jgi:hypothetical protein
MVKESRIKVMQLDRYWANRGEGLLKIGVSSQQNTGNKNTTFSSMKVNVKAEYKNG